MKAPCGHQSYQAVERFALRQKARVEKHLVKKSAIQARLGMCGRKCFCLIPEGWINLRQSLLHPNIILGVSCPRSVSGPSCSGSMLWLLWGNERLLIRVVVLLGIFCFESFQPW